MPTGVYVRKNGGPNKGKGVGITFLRSLAGYRRQECVTWPLSKDDKGYGIVGIDGKSVKETHRRRLTKLPIAVGTATRAA
jgi:hypothetical protein